MPKQLDRLPRYRKHKATGQAVVTLSGHDYYLGPRDKSQSPRVRPHRLGVDCRGPHDPTIGTRSIAERQ